MWDVKKFGLECHKFYTKMVQMSGEIRSKYNIKITPPSRSRFGRSQIHKNCNWWNKVQNRFSDGISNKTRTSKVGAISKAQKAQNNFLEKNLKILKFFFLQKKSHSAEKCKRGTLLDLLTYIPLQNIKNLEGGPFGDIKKFSKKSRTVPKKIQRGDPLGTSCFVGFLEKVNKK